MSLDTEQTNGWKATELLENELLNTALDAIESEVIKLWENAPSRDVDGKEQLWQLYKTSKKFRSLLLGYIETGKLATRKLQGDKGLLAKIKDKF